MGNGGVLNSCAGCTKYIKNNIGRRVIELEALVNSFERRVCLTMHDGAKVTAEHIVWDVEIMRKLLNDINERGLRAVVHG